MLKYAMKHNITEDALADLLHLIKLRCPKPKLVHPHYINKQFQNLYYPMTFHYFCSECFHEVIDPQQSSHMGCSNPYCKNILNERMVSSFIEIPIDLQLKSILECKVLIYNVYT